MPTLKGTKTEQCLKDAFAGESQANRRYLYFANKADIEGQNDVAALFRSTAEGETGHAHGHLEFLEQAGDPATGMPIGSTRQNLESAVAGETHEYTDMYPGMAKTAREEGFDEVADWFETLAKAERSHANRFQKALDNLDASVWRYTGLRGFLPRSFKHNSWKWLAPRRSLLLHIPCIFIGRLRRVRHEALRRR